jgi:diguanylate cyclase (GGDEF)-like protein/putative nucleotidyltransferase with HDIG domain
MGPSRASRLAASYIGIVIAAGAFVFLHSLRQMYLAPVSSQWFILAALTLLTGSFTIAMSSLPARVSVSETFVFASVLLFGTSAGTITVILESLVMSFWLNEAARAPRRLLFNAAATALAIWISGTVFYSFPGVTPHFHSSTSPGPVFFLPLAVFTVLYFLLNTWLIAFAVALHNNRSPLSVWWPHFTWLSVNYFSGASVAALIVTYTQRIDISTLLIFVPLLFISYLTFRTAMGRFDDATKHLGQLNRLYLSTIETLAMAIDAKDQITHGHIRRVQTYAVGLARHIGVGDDQLIRAIEAAALLHDMGKLAVPEYILNKPGRLTPAEFEKMKLHASVGADILSAIDFPYPVVPIVRHHHEYWDGRGYPDGLRGTDIPIGARILSVVDCFDALTSDRPYRPRLSDEEALNILLERRGSMYDPLIVDTFVLVQRQIAPNPSLSGPQGALNEIASSTQAALTLMSGTAHLDEIAASSDEAATLRELSTALTGHTTVAQTGEAIARHLLRLIPFSLLVIFVYDFETDELAARHVAGEAALPLKTMRIGLGKHLSGWVGANRQTILNSDPVLDLGELARDSTPRLRSCLSSPMVLNDALVGVITLYSSNSEHFTEEHRRLIEAVAQQSAAALRRAASGEEPGANDSLTQLPYFSSVVTKNGAATLGGLLRAESLILWIDIIGLKEINIAHGRAAGNEALCRTARCIQTELQPSDSLFRFENDEFIAILNSTDMAGALALASRLRMKVQDPEFSMKDSRPLAIHLSVKCISVPTDVTTLTETLATAKDIPSATVGSRVH